MRLLGRSLARRGTFLSRRRGRARRSRFQPWLSVLEERSLLSLLTVTTAADSGPGSLRDTIAAAGPGDVVNFSPALSGSTIVFGSEIVIDKDLTIQGPGAANLTLDGGEATRIFHITADYADLSGLTLANGLADTGGAVLMDGLGLVLSDCVFLDNTALGVDYDDGPGVESLEAGGGDGDGRGGALQQNGGYVSIFRTTFEDNHAHGADGGIVPDYEAGSIGAAGIAGEPAAGAGFGGGISVTNGWLSILDSTFSSNLAEGGAGLDDPEAYINGGDGAGGAIHHNDSHVFVVHTTFSSNSALGGPGAATGDTGGYGGLGAGGAISGHSGSRLLVVGCTFDSNEAVGGDGGDGDYDSGVGGDGRGGAIENGHDATAIIASSHFVDNAALGGVGGYGEIGGDGQGGALSSLAGSTLALTDSLVEKNRAVGGNWANGGGGGLYTEAESSLGTVVTIAGTTFDCNQATGGASAPGEPGGLAIGGAVANGPGVYLVMTGSCVSNNVAQGTGNTFAYGGGLANFGTAYLTGDQVTGNRANGGVGGNALGGGLSNEVGDGYYGTALYLTDTTIANNVAQGGGGAAGLLGGFASGGGLYNAAPATIRGTTFKGNRAIGGDAGAGTGGGDAYGGGITNFGIYGWISQATTSISNNQAIGGRGTPWVPAGSGRGGGVYVGPSAFYATYLGQINANHAVSGGRGGVGEGGGLFVVAGNQATLRRTPVFHNWASTRGPNTFGAVNTIRW